MIRVALKIIDSRIKQTLLKRLSDLKSDVKISNYQEDNYYDVYFIEIYKHQDIDELISLRSGDSQQIIILIGPSNIDLIKKGYDLEALGYLRIENFTNDIDEMINHLQETISKRFKTYLIQNGTAVSKVRISSIKYVESYRHYLHIHALSGDYVERKNIRDFVTEMANENFIQIHKSYVVNLNVVQVIETNTLLLNDGSVLPIGNIFKKQLLELFCK